MNRDEIIATIQGEHYGRRELNTFLNAVWLTTFAEWDAKAATETAIQKANEAQEIAGHEWDKYHN